MPRQPTTFNLDSKQIYLTYSHCPLVSSFIHNFLNKILQNRHPEEITVTQEDNPEGYPNQHCHLKFSKAFVTKNHRFFDISLPKLSKFWSQQQQVLRPIIKKRLPANRFQRNLQMPQQITDRDSLWSRIINESSSPSDFLKRVRKQQPYTYATKLKRLQYMAHHYWTLAATPINIARQRTTAPTQTEGWERFNYLITQAISNPPESQNRESSASASEPVPDTLQTTDGNQDQLISNALVTHKSTTCDKKCPTDL